MKDIPYMVRPPSFELDVFSAITDLKDCSERWYVIFQSGCVAVFSLYMGNEENAEVFPLSTVFY